MQDVTVDTASGRVRGRAGDDGLCRFWGIPFARPPVGPLRFLPPEPAPAWPGVRDARRPAPIAVQRPTPLDQLYSSDPPRCSEECLALNVVTPGADGARRPVVVWIHGGAFVTGSGSSPWYDGASFARRGDVVVVTINYRLGAFGFLHLADLVPGAPLDCGNAGLLDQVLALRWVRDNIAAFGGDPERVTVFGESAGAMSIGALLGAPAARGLFRGAIAQSGAASTVQDRDQASAVARQVLDALGLEHPDLARLQAVPAEDLLGAQGRVVSRRGIAGMAFQPVLEGVTLPRPPLHSVAGGDAADVALLVGTNRDEMKLYDFLDPATATLGEGELAARLESLVGPDRAERALRSYRRDVGTGAETEAEDADVWTAVLTDQIFRVPALRLADAQVAHQPATWTYLFSWATQAFGGRLGACHALEIPFVFNALDRSQTQLLIGPATDATAGLALAMHDAWIAFAHTGDPAHPGLPPWPAYDPRRRPAMVLDEHPRVENDPDGDRLGLWEPAIGGCKLSRSVASHLSGPYDEQQ